MLTQFLCSAALLAAPPVVDDDAQSETPTPFEKFAAVLRGQTPGPLFGDPGYSPQVYGDPFNNSQIISSPWGGAGGLGVAAFGQHRHGIFGDFLFLSARGADVPFATPVTAGGVPAGRTVSADPEYEPGFRAGFNFALTPTSSLRATYWWYESSTSDTLTAASIRRDAALVPNDTMGVIFDIDGDGGDEHLDGTTFTGAESRYDIDFQKIDLDYVWVGKQTCNSLVNYIVGVRYGHLEQDFRAAYTGTFGETFDPGLIDFMGATRGSSIITDIDFDGVGPRVGIEGERNLGGGGFLVYGAGSASFLLGEFRADYVQNDTFFGPTAAAGFSEDRIVPILEIEAGLGWQDPSGTFRVTAGYLLNAWFNAVTTPELINAVQASNFTDVEDTLSFDGLTVRATWNF